MEIFMASSYNMLIWCDVTGGFIRYNNSGQHNGLNIL